MKEEDSLHLRMRIHGNIGYIYSELELFDKAYTYYQQVLDYAIAHDLKQYLSNTYAKIATCMFVKGHNAEAIKYLEQSITYARSLENTKDLAYTFLIYGSFFKHTKDFERSEKMYEHAMNLYDEVHDEAWSCRARVELAELKILVGDLEEAENKLLKSNLLILGKNNRKIELKISGLLAKIYDRQGRYDKAVTFFKQYHDLKEDFDKFIKQIQLDAAMAFHKEKELDIKIEELQHEKSILESLSVIGREITSSTEINEILETVHRHIFKVVRGDVLVFVIYEEAKIKYHIFEGQRRFEGSVEGDPRLSAIGQLTFDSTFRVYENMLEKPAIAGRAVMEMERMAGLNHLLVSPLSLRDNEIGMLYIGRRHEYPFIKKDEEALKILSSYLSIAIVNWRQARELLMKNERLKALTEHDGLTKVFNRYALNIDSNTMLERAKTYPKDFSVLMIDIDHFKEYNDNYGHLMGDQCLVYIANTLSKLMDSQKGNIYRYGGDEFIITLFDASADEAYNLGEAIRLEVEALYLVHDFSKVSDRVTLTIGIATMIKPLSEMKMVYALADQALYRAKNLGRNNVQQVINND